MFYLLPPRINFCIPEETRSHCRKIMCGFSCHIWYIRECLIKPQPVCSLPVLLIVVFVTDCDANPVDTVFTWKTWKHSRETVFGTEQPSRRRRKVAEEYSERNVSSVSYSAVYHEISTVSNGNERPRWSNLFGRSRSKRTFTSKLCYSVLRDRICRMKRTE